MSKKTKIILGVAVACGARRRPDALLIRRPGQEPAAGDDRQGREGGPGLQGHGQRQDPGPAQGGHVRPRHGPDRQPGGQGGRPRQEGPAPAPDRPGAARGAGAGPRGEPRGDAPRPRRRQGQRRRRRSSTTSAPSRTSRRNILAEADYQKAKSNLDTAEATLAATEQRMHSTMADLAGQPRLALEDDRHGAARRRRDRAPDQGGRGHGHRHDEQRRARSS